MTSSVNAQLRRALLVLVFGIGPGLASATEPNTQPMHGVAQPMPDVAPEQAMLTNAIVSGGRIDLTATAEPDEDHVLSAMHDVEVHGIRAVGDHEGDLSQVVADMPRPFNRTSTVNGRTTYRADSIKDCLAHATSARKGANGTSTITCLGNPFPMAGFLLGSYYDEIGRNEQALAALDSVLPAAPGAPVLLSERGAALAALHRWSDMLANANRGLALDGLDDRDKARLLRSRGYALVELQRLDEAEVAYQESLRSEPANQLAQHELAYIARLRSGGEAAPGGQLNSVQHTKN